MRAILVTQHFTPEITAATFRVRPFADALIKRGHEVEVICPVPNHPAGVIDEEFRGRLMVRRSSPGLSVRYVWIHASPVKTFRTRLSAYGSFAATATIAGAVTRRANVVLASSPPLSVGPAGALLAARHRCPFVLDVRDPWPEVAVTLGELEEGSPPVVAAERLERWLYRRAELILTPTADFARGIESRGARGPVEVVPNGTTRDWFDWGELEVERAELGLPEDRFVLVYAGNLGLAHSLDEAIAAAGQLGDRVHLLIIGEGPRRAELQRQAAELPPGRVEFRDLMAPGEAARHLRAADAVLVAQQQSDAISAKFYDCCAVGRPLIAICRGELARVIEDGGLGLVSPIGSPDGVVRAVERLTDEPGLGSAMVARAREYAADHLRERQAERVAGLLEGLVAP